MTLEALCKNDRDFDDSHALTPNLVRQLDLKALSVGPDGVEMDRLQRAAAEAFESARRI